MHDTDRAVVAYAESSRAAATRKAYDAAWRRFAMHAGGEPLPAEPGQVARYIAAIGQTASAATVRLAVAAIADRHRRAGFPSPTEAAQVRAVVEGHARTAAAPQQSDGITAADYLAITENCAEARIYRGGNIETEPQMRHRYLVDVCLIGTMRDAMLRRSEADAARWRDIRFCPDGTARLTVPRSKTDQIGEGAVCFVSDDVATALLALRTVTEAGPDDKMFPIGHMQICRRIAKACAQAGLVGNYTGHSPRIGMAMDLSLAGMSMTAIMQAGRWKSSKMPAYYVRSIEAGRNAVAQWYKETSDEQDA